MSAAIDGAFGDDRAVPTMTGDGRTGERRRAWVVAGAVALLLVAMARWRQPYPADDAAFYLRYAANLAAGHGYVWNPGTVDAIGASAPLWPLLLAPPIALGLDPWLAMQGVALAIVCIAFAVLLEALARAWGALAVLPAALALAGCDAVMYCTMGGLETPLTLLLLALAVRLALAPAPGSAHAAVLAAVLVAHKIDLLPWAVGLLLATRAWRPGRRAALLVALGVLLVHALAMLWATGSVLPVSFVRKLENSAGGAPTMPATWFTQASLVAHRRWLLLPFAAVGVALLVRRRSPLPAMLAVGAGGQALAYSLFPPTEPFLWYYAPLQLTVAVLLGAVAVPVAAGRPAGIAARIAVGTLVVACAVAAHVSWRSERIRRHWLDYSAHVEADRSRAGQWIAAHSPRSFRVVTGFGCPAFFCERFVFDYSGLNMTGRVDLAYLLAAHRPELLVLCPFGTGVPPDAYEPPAGYQVVKSFATSRQPGRDFYAVVSARADVVDQLGR